MMEVAAVTAPRRPDLPAWRNPATWARAADVLAIMIAAALPWSTSLVVILVVNWTIAFVPTLDPRSFVVTLRRPICAVPVALFALAVAGTLWSDASWTERLRGVSPAAKLLVLPLLLYHFERSGRGMWVFIAFLISCVLLMLMSWIVAFDPGLSLKSAAAAERGIFIKNYIDQSQEFAVCAVALAYPIMTLLRAGRITLAAVLTIIAAGFVVNMAFVIVSRTALVTIPIMLAAFALLHLRWRSIVLIFLATMVIAGVAWQTSPQLRKTADTFISDYQLYTERNEPTSMGLRLEFWKKSLRFFAEAPFIGHGTGSTRGLFEKAAVGEPSAASAAVIGNPHNQTLNVAVQWGVVGVAVLFAMWLAHLLLFRGEGLVAWIGLLVVAQNILTSLFNSHIFDFLEGWMYVLGVGVAGGMVLKKRPQSGPENSAVP